MAGRKFNFAAAEPQTDTGQEIRKIASKKEKHKDTPEKQPLPDPQATTPGKSLAGKAGTLTRKLSAPAEAKAFDFRFVPRNKLRFYENNEYAQENIESLAEKILDIGLIHNLEAFYVLETDTYIIDSGERRCRALDMLIEKYKGHEDTKDPSYQKYLRHVKQFENGYPCNVRLSIGSEDMDMLELRIRHYIANEEIRDRDPAKTAKRIAELNTLYTLRNNSSAEKVNINKKIGEDLGLSDRQVKKYKSVQRLIPELRKKFEENEITLSDGSNYASLSTEEQEELLKLINAGAARKEIEELYRNISAMKKDITTKEHTIKSLEHEKQAAIDETKRAQEESAMLREKLREESNRENPEPEKIAALEQDAKKAADKMARLEKEHKKTITEKNREIDMLKKQIKKQQNSMTASEEFRKSAKLDMNIRQLREVSESLKECFESYKATYEESKQSPPSPEEYRKEIKKILEEATKILK